MNVIARLEYELAYYDSAVHRFNHYTTGTPPREYLQVHVQKTLWPFQTVKIGGQRYCLTRLWFGLNVALLIMKAIVSAVLSREEAVGHAASAYIDIYVNEDIMPATRVREHLARFELECKDPERLEDGAQMGLAVAMEHGKLWWKRGSMVPDAPFMVTWRAVLSSCGRFVGHLPVCCWLRVACGVLKRRTSSVTKGWDDEMRDNLLQRMISETVDSVQQDDPAHGDWCVDGQELNVWVDASSLVIRVALERHETVFEDACWLRSENDAQHINLAELDAVLKGINLALQWQCKVLHVKTDSVCEHQWVSDTLTGRTRVRTKAATEMLFRRQLNTFKKLVGEYELTVDGVLVPSNKNMADRLTRVPQRWFTAIKMENWPKPLVGVIHVDELNADQIMAIHIAVDTQECGVPLTS